MELSDIWCRTFHALGPDLADVQKQHLVQDVPRFKLLVNILQEFELFRLG